MEKQEATQAAPPSSFPDPVSRTYTDNDLGDPRVTDMDVPYGGDPQGSLEYDTTPRAMTIPSQTPDVPASVAITPDVPQKVKTPTPAVSQHIKTPTPDVAKSKSPTPDIVHAHAKSPTPDVSVVHSPSRQYGVSQKDSTPDMTPQ